MRCKGLGGAALALLGLTAGCVTDLGEQPGGGSAPTGSSGQATGTGGNGSGGGTGGGGPVVDEDGNVISRPFTEPVADPAAIPARAWLLTHEQYARAVGQVLGASVDVSAFAPELDNGEYKNYADVGLVRVDLAQDYAETAEQVTAGLTVAALQALSPTGTLDAASADAFIAAMASRAFRRPAASEDVQRFRGLFDVASGGDDATYPFRVVLRGLLTSPYFLYRTEIGARAEEANPAFQLTDHELATFASFSLTGEPPNAELLSAADRGELRDPVQLRTHVDALLASPTAGEQLKRFLTEWLEVDAFEEATKFEETFPGFESVRAAMQAEVDAFLAQSGSVATGSLTALLTSPVPSAGPALDSFYRSDPTAAGTEQRIGLLALGTVLSHLGKPNLTSPTMRGLFVRERILCQHVQLPPDFSPPPLSETQERAQPETTRELYELHASEPVCASCHQLIDPIGFNLEGFDGAGRFRTHENGIALDTAGALVETDVDRPVTGPVELAEALAESRWAAECMARQAYRFYYGRTEPSRGVAPVIEARTAAGAVTELRPLVAALVSSSGFQRVRQ